MMQDINAVEQRTQELAWKNLIGTATTEEKQELRLLVKDVKKAIRADNKVSPEKIIAKLESKIEKLNQTIIYVRENGKLPVISQEVKLDEAGNPIIARRGRPAGNNTNTINDSDFSISE